MWRLADSKGCPLRGVRPRRWRCGCRARMAPSDRAAGVLRVASRPASRLVHRPEPTGATSPMRSPRRRSCRPSFRGCVRAPPRAPRVGQGVRPPAAGADAGRGPRSASGSPGPARPGAVPTRRAAAKPAARSAASTAASRPIPDGISRRGDARPRARWALRCQARGIAIRGYEAHAPLKRCGRFQHDRWCTKYFGVDNKAAPKRRRADER